MNAEGLIAHYERIADTPDAIARLRRFVLDLAVRGKLVLQDPNDEPASEVIKLIQKARFPQACLPRLWGRTTVGAVLDFQYGKGLNASQRQAEGPVPVYGSNGILGFTQEALTTNPTIIVGRKGSAGALNLCEGPSWTTDVAYFVEPPAFFALRFLLIALMMLDLDKLAKGVKPGLSRSDAYRKTLVIPPLGEQRRIIAKVDELMALCDRLDASRERSEATRDRLTATSLARLNTPDPDTFQEDARFALDALQALTARPDQVKKLRQTVLSLAVRGKLVPQAPDDEPASELLKRIAAEKALLVKTGQIRRETPILPITESNLSVDLPSGWHLAKLGSLIHLVSGQHLLPSEYSEDPKQGLLPYITGPSDFGPVGLQITRFALVKKAVATRGQLLITVKGSGVGKTTTCDIPEVAISRQLMAITPIGWDSRFLMLVAHGLAEKLQQDARSLIPGISREDVQEFVFAFPPLAEQHRIVGKVDELMALCERLEASLATSEDTRRRLLDALLAEAVEPDERRHEQAA